MSGYQKIASITLYIVAGISVLMAGLYYLGGSVPETIGTNFEEFKFTSQILIWAVILFIIAAATTLIFSFTNVFSNPKALKGFLISLGAGVVLIAISYVLASDEMLTFLPENIQLKTTAGALKWSGTGMIATYILFVVAIAGIIISEIAKAFK